MSDALADLEKIALDVRSDVIEISNRAKVGHIGSSLSIADVLTVLYFAIMNIDPKNPAKSDRDRFILSKGHAAAVLYATLHRRGYFSRKKLYTFCADGGLLPVHPETHLKGVDATTGSLGHGLSLGVGMALGSKLAKNGARTFVILSDGECDEGSTWEAILSAAQFKLDNLVAIVDYNKFQAFGRTNEVMNLEPFAAKWVSFGWQVYEVGGHNIPVLLEKLQKVPIKKDKPTVLISHSVMGKGISFMEDKLEWHYNTMKPEQYEQALSELKKS